MNQEPAIKEPVNPFALQNRNAANMPAEKKASALNVMAARYSLEPDKLFATLKATVFKGATNEELVALVVVSNEYKLNPFLKQIYAFPAKGGGIVPVVSVDGWLRIVNDQPNLDGVEFEWEWDKDGKPISCTGIIWIKGRSKPVRIPEYFEECQRSTDPWRQMPRRMLRHKALIQCARVAFGLGGIFDEDEAADIQKRQGLIAQAPVFDVPDSAATPTPDPVAPTPEPPKQTRTRKPKEESIATTQAANSDPGDDVPMSYPEPLESSKAGGRAEPGRPDFLASLKSMITASGFSEATFIETCVRRFKGPTVKTVDEFPPDYVTVAVRDFDLIQNQMKMDRATA